MEFRNLESDEIECRIGTISKNGNGLSLLLYKDARVDMKVLDETVGPENWQCEFYECKGTLFCKVGILVERELGKDANGYLHVDSEWVWKSNAGAPSNMEAEKGEASDAFKRACVAWGIGRELYTAPFIWVKSEKCNIVDRNGKKFCNDRFKVAKIAIRDGCIVGVRIVRESDGIVAFSWKKED